MSPTPRIEVDVAVIGSGFAGSLMALVLRRLGRRVALIERDRHPRFAIGESSTPLANLLIEELAERYALPRIRPLSKWGTWRASYPDLGVGLKRGFSFFHHAAGSTPLAGHDRPLLVAASPHTAVADTHWYRPDVDAFLAREAEAAGVTYLDETALSGVEWESCGGVLAGTRRGRSVGVRAGFVVDASGPRGFLYRTQRLAARPWRSLPPTQGLYAHFEGVERWEALSPSVGEPPYPVDDAAVHHLFEGGWIWVLRFANGITSAGAALSDVRAAGLAPADGSRAWGRLLQSLPALRATFAHAREVHPFVHVPRLSFRSATVHGPHFALLPSAVGVVDPLLSTGFPLTLLGISRLAAAFEAADGASPAAAHLAAYAEQTQAELEATEGLVAALYASLSDFALFKKLSLLYFAAASFSESVRRLGRPERAPGFLLCRHPAFGPESAAIAAAARNCPQGAARAALLGRIERAIEPFDVAGLGDPERRDWYPVCAEDLRRSAARLDATPRELQGLLARCGFGATTGAAAGSAAL
jgi:tetracycline 7-halogenase / FADH2 O2-dependent halogenase